MLIYFCIRKNCIWEDSSKDLKPPLTIWSHLPLHGSTVCSIDQKLHHRNKKRLAKTTPHGKSTSQAKEIKPIMWARIQEISVQLLPLLCDREIHFLALCLCWHLWNENTSSLPTFDCLIYLESKFSSQDHFLWCIHPVPRTRRLRSLLHCCHCKTAALCRHTSGEMQPLLSLTELLGTLWHKRINYSFVLPDAHYLYIRGNRVVSVSKGLIKTDDCLLGCNTQLLWVASWQLMVTLAASLNYDYCETDANLG